MNAPAVELYRSKGVDLTKEPLQIALCAQHHNGGIAVDAWWQSSLPGLFAAGECAGTHGITRPGGSALNAGQVGSLRASQYICENAEAPLSEAAFAPILSAALDKHQWRKAQVCGKDDNVTAAIAQAQRRMSDCAAAIRQPELLSSALENTKVQLAQLDTQVGVESGQRLYLHYKLRDILWTQQAVLTAMAHYAKTAGCTRGSSLYFDKSGALRPGLEESFRFTADSGNTRDQIQETLWDGSDFICRWRPVRPIPQEDDFFENVWREYRIHKNIY
jgi:succinate dehydrogenase/fumarate reductase flavoprotein subunit